MRHSILIVAAVLVVGCQPATPPAAPPPLPEPEPEATAEPAPEPAPAPRPAPATPPPAAPLWSEEGLAAQPRMDALRRSVPERLGYEPGTTRWRPVRLDLPPSLRPPGAASTPGALLAEVTAYLGLADPLGTELWELTSRIWMGEGAAAVGVVLAWGMMDDSVVGHDVRVRMRRGAGGWYVEAVEERFHCARGVAGELCV